MSCYIVDGSTRRSSGPMTIFHTELFGFSRYVVNSVMMQVCIVRLVLAWIKLVCDEQNSIAPILDLD